MKKKSILLVLILCVGICSSCGLETSNGKGEEEKSYQVGEEITTVKISEADGEKYQVKYKITDVNRDPAYVSERIDTYNSSGRGQAIDFQIGEDLEYVVVSYQVIYPEDFPTGEYGITTTPIGFEVVNLQGEDKIKVGNTNYNNLGTTIEIGDIPMGFDFFNGDTYNGSIVFLMIKGSSDYLLKEVYVDGREGSPTYIRGQ